MANSTFCTIHSDPMLLNFCCIVNKNPGQGTVTTPTRGERGGASRQWWEKGFDINLTIVFEIRRDMTTGETCVCDPHPSCCFLASKHTIYCTISSVQVIWYRLQRLYIAGTLNLLSVKGHQHLTIQARGRVPSLVTPSALSEMILQSSRSTSCACCSLKATLALHAPHSKMLTPFISNEWRWNRSGCAGVTGSRLGCMDVAVIDSFWRGCHLWPLS